MPAPTKLHHEVGHDHLPNLTTIACGFILLSACSYDPDNLAPSSRAESEQRLAYATKSDVIAARPITLSGDVELIGFAPDDEPVDVKDRDASGSIRQYRVACGAMCAALLATPGVKSVSVVDGSATPRPERGRTFHIVRKAQCSRGTVMPVRPDALDLDRPRVAPRPATHSLEEARAMDRRDLMRNVETLETAWKIRLATTDCIRADPVRHSFDFVIRQTHASSPSDPDKSGDACQSKEPFPVWIDSLELLDRSGAHLLRLSHATTNALAVPLSKDLCGNIGGVLPGLGWKRVAIETGAPVRVDALIASHTNLQTTIGSPVTREAVSRTLRNALDNRRLPASDPAFSLAETYLRVLASGTIASADRIMLVDMIRDERVVAFSGLRPIITALGPDSGFLRAPIVERIGRANTNRDAADMLSEQIKSLPRAGLGKEEREILADPVRRSRAIGLVRAAIESGELSNDALVQMLADHAARLKDPKSYRSPSGASPDRAVIDAVREGLCLRGGRAKDVLPSLVAMQSEQMLPPNIVESDGWQFMLARLGRPAEQLLTPQGQSREGYIHRVEARLDPQRSEQSDGGCRY